MKSKRLALISIALSLIPFTKPILIGSITSYSLSTLLLASKARSISKSDIGEIAKQVTVQIKGGIQGSGVIISSNNNSYKVLTNWHVIKDNQPSEEVGIITSDGKEHLWESNSLRRIGELDLATFTFLSPKKYQIASFGDSTKIRMGNTIYIAGFPLPSKSFPINLMRFLQGQIIAKASVEIPYGYQLLYSNQTLSGMSGGPILDSNGDLIGIHGRAEKHNQITNQLGKIIATGTNQGIPIENFINFADKKWIYKNSNTSITLDDYLVKIADIFSQNLDIGLKNKKQFNKIIILANSALEIDPENQNALIYLARANLGLKKNKIALKFANRAIELNNNNLNAIYTRGRIKIELYDYQSGIEDFNLVKQKDPLSIYFNPDKMIGIAYLFLKNHQSAIIHFDKAIRINPLDANSIANRGYSKMETADYIGANKDFTKALELAPNEAGGFANLGDLKLKLRYFEEAINDFTNAINIDNDYSYAYVGRGDAKQKLGKFDDAIKDYTKAIKINNKELFGYINRGYLLIKKNKINQGCSDYKKALALNENLSRKYIQNEELINCKISI